MISVSSGPFIHLYIPQSIFSYLSSNPSLLLSIACTYAIIFTSVAGDVEFAFKALGSLVKDGDLEDEIAKRLLEMVIKGNLELNCCACLLASVFAGGFYFCFCVTVSHTHTHTHIHTHHTIL